MDLRDVKKEWDYLGKSDPLWAILTHNNKAENKWNLNDFFATGEKEISELIKHLKDINLEFKENICLDFWCGVGRLSQALLGYFEKVIGIDISPSMLNLANKYNKETSRCKYILNDKETLEDIENDYFDFIYTSIVLQHVEPKYIKMYIKEFIRILSPWWILVFQLPSTNSNLLIKIIKFIKDRSPLVLKKLINKLRWNRGRMEMFGINKEEIINFLSMPKVKIVDIQKDDSAWINWVSYKYYVLKES